MRKERDEKRKKERRVVQESRKARKQTLQTVGMSQSWMMTTLELTMGMNCPNVSVKQKQK